MKITHITTAHARNEVRIFQKECLSLVSAGHEVQLIVSDGLGQATEQGVRIYDVGLAKGRFHRMFLLPFKIVWKTMNIKTDVCHIHEPELLLIAVPLIFSGKKVVYDSHEDVPRAILSREWISLFLRGVVSRTFEIFENFVVARISAVIGATPHIANRFAKINGRTVVINNYPLLSELPKANLKRDGGDDGGNKVLCYQGSISKERGIFEMLCALQYTQASIVLVGPVSNNVQEVVNEQKSKMIKYHGVVSRAAVNEIMQHSQVGLLLFHPEPNHIKAQPNKMFEYMGVGLPVVASNFPLWREIIEGNECGICVDPFDVQAIANAINYLLDNPEIAQKMGENGKQAVLKKYNWSFEEKKLVALYGDILRNTEK